MKTTIAILMLALLQATSFAITYSHNPTDNFAAYYLAWVLIPALVAALVFAPRFHFIAAIFNAIIATLLFDYLLLWHGYFWPERPKESPGLAVGYVLLGVVLAFVVAGFVHASIERIKRMPVARRMPRTLAAVRQGLVFSLICAVVAFPLCTMFGPVGPGVTSRPTFMLATIVASCFLIFGTLISLIVGLTFDPTKLNSENRGITKRCTQVAGRPRI